MCPPPFDLLNPYRGRGYVKGQNNCLNSVLCFIPFNLICNMTTFRKENKITFDPTPGVKGKCVPYISLCKTCVSQVGAFFSSRHDLNNLGRVHLLMLHTKYPGSMPCFFRQEEFFTCCLYKPI